MVDRIVNSIRNNTSRQMSNLKQDLNRLSGSMASGKKNITDNTSLELIQKGLYLTQTTVLKGASSAAGIAKTNINLAINALNKQIDLAQNALELTNAAALDPTANLIQLYIEYRSIAGPGGYIDKVGATTKNINGTNIFGAPTNVQVSALAADVITVTPGPAGAIPTAANLAGAAVAIGDFSGTQELAAAAVVPVATAGSIAALASASKAGTGAAIVADMTAANTAVAAGAPGALAGVQLQMYNAIVAGDAEALKTAIIASGAVANVAFTGVAIATTIAAMNTVIAGSNAPAEVTKMKNIIAGATQEIARLNDFLSMLDSKVDQMGEQIDSATDGLDNIVSTNLPEASTEVNRLITSAAMIGAVLNADATLQSTINDTAVRILNRA